MFRARGDLKHERKGTIHLLEGICIAVALVGLMYFAYRGWSIILIAPIFAGVAALASIFGVLPTYSELYITRMAEYTNSY